LGFAGGHIDCDGREAVAFVPTVILRIETSKIIHDLRKERRQKVKDDGWMRLTFNAIPGGELLNKRFGLLVNG
jgi:hypothetical protein